MKGPKGKFIIFEPKGYQGEKQMHGTWLTAKLDLVNLIIIILGLDQNFKIYKEWLIMISR